MFFLMNQTSTQMSIRLNDERFFLFHRKNPIKGSSNTPFALWLPAEYQDGISQPKGWDADRRVNNYLLPLVQPSCLPSCILIVFLRCRHF